MGKSDIENCVIDAFCQLVPEAGYNRVRISDICERAHLSRKTLYSYFANKETILSVVVARDITTTTLDLFRMVTREGAGESASNMLTELIFERLHERKIFYSAMCAPECEATLTRVMSNVCENCHLLLANRTPTSEESQLSYASIYGSRGFAAVLIHWIKNGMKTSPKQMAKWTSEWGMSSASIGF